MTTWIITGDTDFLSSMLEEQSLEIDSAPDIDDGDTILLYRTDEQDLVGPFSVHRVIPTGSDSLLLVEHNRELKRQTIESESDRDRYSTGPVALDRTRARVITRRLQRSDETIDSEETDEPEPPAIDSLLDIHRASVIVEATGRDFSGEDHGELKLRNAILRGSDLSSTQLSCSSFEDADLRDVDFRGADLSNADFSGASLAGADFRGADLTGAEFDQKLSEARFTRANMTKADLRGSTLEGANLSKTILRHARLQRTRPRKASFDNASLNHIQCEGTEFVDASFRHADLSETEFAAADFSGADFQGADLTRVNLTRPTIDDASFRGATLRGATFDGQEATGVDFSEADCSDASRLGEDLPGASFADLRFSDARFAGARLDGATFTGADISGAVMTDAKANRVDFERANLERVAFSQTELFGSNFGGASFYGAILQSARIGGDTRFHLDDRSVSPTRLDALLMGDVGDVAGRVVYDPLSEEPVHKGTSDTPEPIEKAMSVYQTLETVMQENAYGDQASAYFLLQKEMQRRHHRSKGDFLGVPTSHSWWINVFQRFSCNYGESFQALFIWATVVVVALGLAYPIAFELTHQSLGGLSFSQVGPLSLWYGLLFSLSAFTGLGYGQYDVNSMGETLATVETASGVVFFALLVFVLTRQVGR